MSESVLAGKPAEVHLAQAAYATVYFEKSALVRQPRKIVLGRAFVIHPSADAFGALHTTATTRNFLLRNIVFDADSLLLLKDDKIVAETSYFLPDELQDRIRVLHGSLIRRDHAEDVIVACNRVHNHYQHWMTQCLPAIDWSIRHRRHDRIRLLLPQLEPWQEDTLTLLGHAAVPRLTPEPGKQYMIPYATYSDFLNGSVSFQLSLCLVDTGQRLANAVPSTPSPHRAIYVPCTNPYYGHIENEPEVVDFLRRRNVHVVSPNDLSVAARINLFRQVDVVIGPQGQGLTDILFCKPGAALWEWTPSHLQNASYNRLAQAVGLDYWGDLFEQTRDDGTGRWRVDLDVLAARLQIIPQLRGPAPAIFPVTHLTRTPAQPTQPSSATSIDTAGGAPMLPETLLAATAATQSTIETSVPGQATSPGMLGPGFATLDLRRAFGPVSHTLELHDYHLPHVFLDAGTFVLITQDGRRISETNYLVTPRHYEQATIRHQNLVWLEDGRDYVLGCNGSFRNYFHWMTQALPAIDWSLRSGDSANITMALPSLGPWQEETLRLMGYHQISRLLLDPDRHYHFPRLRYSDFLCGRAAFGISAAATGAYTRLRDAALGDAAPALGEILYIARSDAHQRSLVNEQELMAALEGEGVRIVAPGGHALRDQVVMFNRASAIIGPHGAGLTNIVFCRPDTIVYELVPGFHTNPCYRRLAQAAGLTYYADLFEGLADQSWRCDLSVVLARLRQLRQDQAVRRVIAG